MKISNSLKLAGVLLTSVGLTVGCAGTTEQEAPAQESAPTTTAAPAETTPMPAATSGYTVEKGDNLWNISGKSDVYGNPYQWPLIYKSNSDQIKDADLIYPGQNLSIDTNPSAGDVDAAVQHAKTRGSWSVGAVEASDTAYLAQ